LIKRLDPVLVLAEYPVLRDREGLYICRCDDGFVVWCETPDGDRWKAQAVIEIEPLTWDDVSEELYRQRGIITDA